MWFSSLFARRGSRRASGAAVVMLALCGGSFLIGYYFGYTAAWSDLERMRQPVSNLQTSR